MTAPCCILVVDDDDDVRDAQCVALQAAGYRTMAAKHGADALELLRAPGAHVDLIVLDAQMPVMDGLTFGALQRADPLLARIPVVACSASDDALWCINACAHLRKPYTIDDLVARVRLWAGPPALAAAG
jgi:CheY-like chemotaxis protein